MYRISTAKCPRAFEALAEIIVKLYAAYLIYLGFNWFVEKYIEQNVAGDTLLSLLILPAFYILKDLNLVIEPFTVNAERYTDRISVKRGIAPRVTDTLEFKFVENTEIITTPLGFVLGYSTIRLHSPGGNVEIPHAFNANKVIEIINSAKNGT